MVSGSGVSSESSGSAAPESVAAGSEGASGVSASSSSPQAAATSESNVTSEAASHKRDRGRESDTVLMTKPSYM